MNKIMDNLEMISIIIPVYKVSEQYLCKCIESVTSQTYTNIQIILVDDGSPDNCGKICDQYSKKDERIIVIHKENQGVSMARNDGIKLAKGSWIVFVDCDDYIEPSFCEKMLNAATDNKSQCVICSYNRVYEEKIEKVKKESNLLMDKEEFLKNILNVQSGFGFCHMKLWKADVIKNNNVQFNGKLKVAEDALFCMQMSKYVNSVYFLNGTLYNYRFNSESVVRKFDENYVKKYLDAMKIEKKYIQTTYDNKYLKELYNYIAYHVLLVIINYCFHPDNKNKGIKLLKKICNIEEFKEAIKYSNYNGFSITRKITLFTLKHKLYILTSIIANIRQYQFRK